MRTIDQIIEQSTSAEQLTQEVASSAVQNGIIERIESLEFPRSRDGDIAASYAQVAHVNKCPYSRKAYHRYRHGFKYIVGELLSKETITSFIDHRQQKVPITETQNTATMHRIFVPLKQRTMAVVQLFEQIGRTFSEDERKNGAKIHNALEIGKVHPELMYSFISFMQLLNEYMTMCSDAIESQMDSNYENKRRLQLIFKGWASQENAALTMYRELGATSAQKYQATGNPQLSQIDIERIVTTVLTEKTEGNGFEANETINGETHNFRCAVAGILSSLFGKSGVFFNFYTAMQQADRKEEIEDFYQHYARFIEQ